MTLAILAFAIGFALGAVLSVVAVLGMILVSQPDRQQYD
jgi:hypothetical protein